MDFQRLLTILRLIESASIDYMVTGSIASILYGRPRLTQDMDIVIVLSASKIAAFQKLFNNIDEYYCPPEEAIMEALNLGNKGHLNIMRSTDPAITTGVRSQYSKSFLTSK